MDERPWLKQYDKGVPFTIDYPPVPLFYFLEEAARKASRNSLYDLQRRSHLIQRDE